MTETASSTTDAAEIVKFIAGKVGNQYYRFEPGSEIPDDIVTFNFDLVKSMTKSELDDLYSDLAKIGPKKFKDKRVAIDSVVYQVMKLGTYAHRVATVPSAARAKTTALASAKAPGTAATASQGRAPKGTGFKLLAPTDFTARIAELPPQARELLAIASDVAVAVGATSISNAAWSAEMDKPETTTRLRAKQPPARIYAYYKKRLIESGLIELLPLP